MHVVRSSDISPRFARSEALRSFRPLMRGQAGWPAETHSAGHDEMCDLVLREIEGIVEQVLDESSIAAN